jgi:hypothetical protein
MPACDQFVTADWPIGIGAVESANMVVVEARLKGAGMHWRRDHADAMVGLRAFDASDRWDWTLLRIVARLSGHLKANGGPPRQTMKLPSAPAPALVIPSRPRGPCLRAQPAADAAPKRRWLAANRRQRTRRDVASSHVVPPPRPPHPTNLRRTRVLQ